MQYELLLNNGIFAMVLNNFPKDYKHDVTNKLLGKTKKMGCFKGRNKPGKDSLTKEGTVSQVQIGKGTTPQGPDKARSRVSPRKPVRSSRRQGQRQNWSAGSYTNLPPGDITRYVTGIKLPTVQLQGPSRKNCQ